MEFNLKHHWTFTLDNYTNQNSMLMKEGWRRNEIDTLPRPVQNAGRSLIEHILRKFKLRVKQMNPKNHQRL